jgi:hypothetical protein
LQYSFPRIRYFELTPRAGRPAIPKEARERIRKMESNKLTYVLPEIVERSPSNAAPEFVLAIVLAFRDKALCRDVQSDRS